MHTDPRILVLPNAWDAVSARLFEEAGFPAIATTSAGVASTLGYPDGQRVPREEMLFVAGRMAATVQIPVTVDIEIAYGADSVEETLKTVRGVLDAGCVGINLEDAVDVDASALADVGLQVEKIRAIRDLANAAGVPLVINARTDAFHMSHLDASARFDTAVERANVYREAGADCLFVPFVTDAPTLSALAKAIHGPLNVLAMPPSPTVPELEQMGVARVSMGSGVHRATLALVRHIAAQLRDTGAYTSFTTSAIPYAEANQLFMRAG